MNNEEDNIQALSRAVMTEARSEAEQTLTEARQKAEAIRADSERQAQAERARILENANKEAARLRSQAVAAAHLKARTYQLEQRELLLNKVFEQAAQRLAEIQKNGSYADIVLNLLKNPCCTWEAIPPLSWRMKKLARCLPLNGLTRSRRRPGSGCSWASQ